MSRVGIVVLSWNGGARTFACVDSARGQSYQDRFIVVVDNASTAVHQSELRTRYQGAPDVELCFLDRNTGYAEGNNHGLRRAFARGAEWTLIATQDSRLEPLALARLLEVGVAVSSAGIVGPRVIDITTRQTLSLGERVSIPLLCMPRTLLRYRRARLPWYPVSGVLGCALLLSRRCFESTAGFDETYFAYYEEVDLCLRARAAGFQILCAPAAVAEHDGMRGFLRGLTPLSAELKTRNLWRLMRHHARAWHWPVLLPSFAGLVATSLGLYALRGRPDLIRALLRGVAAGWRDEAGPTRSLLEAP